MKFEKFDSRNSMKSKICGRSSEREDLQTLIIDHGKIECNTMQQEGAGYTRVEGLRTVLRRSLSTEKRELRS